ncbi:MAG: PaaI family thioesterase [Leptospira sp.]|nr:PaaI family thioesterase [Leptospira sp.]
MKNPEEYIRYFENKDRFGSLLNVKPVKVSDEECLYEYTAVPEHYNPNGMLHGGALYGAMDSAQGAFVHFIVDTEHHFATTATASIRYRKALKNEKVLIRVRLKEKKKKLLYVIAEAILPGGEIVAELDETWMILPKTG